MKYKFIVHGRMVGMNELIDADRENRYKGAALKKQAQMGAMWCIRQQLRGVHIDKPVMLHYAYYEPNKKRDKDNVSAGAHKIVQDALVQTGVLKNDGWKHVQGSTDLVWEVDAQNPRVEVTIEEATANDRSGTP